MDRQETNAASRRVERSDKTRSAGRGRIIKEGTPLRPGQVEEYMAALENAYTSPSEPACSGVVTVDGHGAKLDVFDGHLRARDGEGWLRRERSYNRATGGLRRVIVLADSGLVSIGAIRWCREANVSLVVMQGDEVVLAEGPLGRVDARLLRLQACPPEGLAVEAAAMILGTKLAGQAGLARSVLESPATTDTLDSLAAAMEVAETVDEARQLEASAANAYFSAWAGSPATSMSFARQDAKRVPAHWCRFEARRSPLGNGSTNRRAADPLNALLNLTYRLAGVECRLAAMAMGLHPALGFVHQDGGAAEPLVWDLLETIRADVDRHVLDLVAKRCFRRGDFLERSDGTVRIAPALVGELAATLPTWSRLVAPHTERLHHLIGHAVVGRYRPAQPLTGAKRRVAQADVKARKAAAKKATQVAMATIRPGVGERAVQPTLWRCPECGGSVEDSHHVRCLDCQAKDPRQAPEVRGRRGAAIAARKAKQTAWEAVGGHSQVSPEWYASELLPRLEGVKLSAIVAVTGWSKSYASVVRRGRYIPHVSTWPALAQLLGASSNLDSRSE